MNALVRSRMMAVGCWLLAIGGAGFKARGLRLQSILRYSLLIILYSSLTACNSDPKFQQYFVEGEQLYNTHCSNCHQKNGKGLGLVYPPLAGSDYMDNNRDQVICLMKRGISGEIRVNDKSFNQTMPGVPSLTELEIAEIATFIYNSWGHQKGLVEMNTVARALQSCPPQ